MSEALEQKQEQPSKQIMEDWPTDQQIEEVFNAYQEGGDALLNLLKARSQAAKKEPVGLD